MAKREPLIDKIERWVFGASAAEAAEMRLKLATREAERRLEQRIIAALEEDATDGAADVAEQGA